MIYLLLRTMLDQYLRKLLSNLNMLKLTLKFLYVYMRNIFCVC